MTQVTGILTDEVGTVLANTTCAVVAIDQVVGQDGGGRVSRGSIVVTNGAGEFDADIKPGRYELVVEVSAPADANVKFRRAGRLTVLTTGPMTLEEELDTSFGPINPSILQQAIDAKDAAEAAAVLAQSAYQGRQYATRAEFVADTGYAPDDGTKVSADGLSYVRSAGATALPGLPGWLPFGNWSVRHFGAVGDAVTNDAPAFQACIDAATAASVRMIYIPPAIDAYLIATTLTTTTFSGGFVFYSDATSQFSYGPTIKCGHDGILFDVAGTLTRFQNIRFTGDRSLYPNSVAIRFRKTANTDDMDAKVFRCDFHNFPVCVQQYGRGLYFQNNLVALSTIGVEFYWPESGIEAGVGEGLHPLPYGYRKWLITDNQFHAVTRALENKVSEPMRGALIANNLLDIGRSFWKGPMINSLITGNVVENLNSVGIEINFTANGVQIVGNRMSGMQEPDPEDNMIHQGTVGIWINTSGTTDYVMIANNQISFIKHDGIRLQRQFRGGQITGNIISRYNLDNNADYAAINFLNASNLSTAIFRSVVQGNTGEAPSTGSFLRIASGGTPASIIDNIYAARVNWS